MAKGKLITNYEAFYAMTLAVGLLNSADLGDFRKDAEKIITFFGSVYEIKSAVLADMQGLILGDMMKIGLVSDYHALNSLENLSAQDLDNLAAYELKGRILEDVNRANRRDYFYSNYRLNHDLKQLMKYESFHHAYDAHIRFSQIKIQAAYGDLFSTRQLAILYILGIGCEPSPQKAILHLKRCLLWGDLVATRLLRQVYRQCGDEESAALYDELYALQKKYYEDNIIDLPPDETASDAARTLLRCISLIKSCLIVPERLTEINIAFLNVLDRDNVSPEEKFAFIIRYKENTWKNAIYSVEKSNRTGL